MINFKLQLFQIPQYVPTLMDVEYYADVYVYAVLHELDFKRIIDIVIYIYMYCMRLHTSIRNG